MISWDNYIPDAEVNMIIKEMPVSERPREKMLRYGCQSLSNAELIAALIGTGSRKASAIHVAERLLSKDSEGLKYLGECTIEELSQIDGIGTAKACQITAAVELGKRISLTTAGERRVISSCEDAAGLFMERMRYFKEEHFQVLLINAAGGVISVEEVAIGSVMSLNIHPREVFSKAIRKGAAAVVLAHNHPSGNCQPSREDLETTKRLQEAGRLLGIHVLDHIVIGDGRFISLKNEHLM